MHSAQSRAAAPEHLDLPFALKAVETLRADDGAEVGVFEGLASSFGERDLVGDVIEPGAFRDGLARPRRVRMLWQHNAGAPIGVWESLRETPEGLAVRGRLVLDVRQAREALALLRAGAVDSLSIGFSVPKGGAVFDRARAARRLRRVDLWEISIVTFPANPKARVARVMAREGARQPEQAVGPVALAGARRRHAQHRLGPARHHGHGHARRRALDRDADVLRCGPRALGRARRSCPRAGCTTRRRRSACRR